MVQLCRVVSSSGAAVFASSGPRASAILSPARLWGASVSG
jgi:hypothetical protein